MPKAIYRWIRQSSPEQGTGLVLISGSDKSAAYTDKQIKKHLLCESCEMKFSHKGEDKIIPFMSRPNGFKLATKIKKFKKLSQVKDEIWYFPQDEKLASSFMYFAISIAWRLSITDWSAFGLPQTKNSIRKESMDTFSEYLLGYADLPENTYLAVYVDNQIVDTPSMSFPTVKNHDGYQHIVFNIPGIKFSLITGKNPGDDIREMFSINVNNAYFISRSLKSHPDHHFLVNFLKYESVAKGRLLKERNQNV